MTRDEVIENIDIGGPSMLRSAAKNFESVTVVVDPADYPRVLAGFEAQDDDIDLRRPLAEKVFAHTAAYDSAISTSGSHARGPRNFLTAAFFALNRAQTLRYGENPGQRAAFYVEASGNGLAGLQQKGGKELSFNNFLDLEGAPRNRSLHGRGLLRDRSTRLRAVSQPDRAQSRLIARRSPAILFLHSDR